VPILVPFSRANGRDANTGALQEARYEGRTQRGEAYFRADQDERKVESGTGAGYRGWMQVVEDGDGSMLTLGLHTSHVEHADHDVAATLDAIRRLVEASV
jgi:hypothetical protein